MGNKTREWLIAISSNLLATFAGVFLALHVSETSSSHSEKELLCSLLTQAQYELDAEKGAVSAYLEASKLPIRNDLDLRFFDEIIIHPLLAKHAPEVSALLRLHRRLLAATRAIIMSDLLSNEWRQQNLKEYREHILITKDSLALGIQYLKGDISRRRIENEVNKRMLLTSPSNIEERLKANLKEK